MLFSTTYPCIYHVLGSTLISVMQLSRSENSSLEPSLLPSSVTSSSSETTTTYPHLHHLRQYLHTRGEVSYIQELYTHPQRNLTVGQYCRSSSLPVFVQRWKAMNSDIRDNLVTRQSFQALSELKDTPKNQRLLRRKLRSLVV